MYRISNVGFSFKAVLTAAVLFLCGCDGTRIRPSVDKVSGTVRLNDKIVNYGSVIFRDANGQERKVFIDSNGNYSVVNPPLGEVRVMVRTGPPPTAIVAAPASGGAKSPAPVADGFKRILLPAKYADPDTTDLLYTVGSGEHEFDINMKSEPETKATDKKDNNKS